MAENTSHSRPSSISRLTINQSTLTLILVPSRPVPPDRDLAGHNLSFSDPIRVATALFYYEDDTVDPIPILVDQDSWKELAPHVHRPRSCLTLPSLGRPLVLPRTAQCRCHCRAQARAVKCLGST
ncbi:hypothetical protein EV363DRAFT_1441082 [Boletus edulis]|uniref:Uncharacterized protein n=1 Tax=Boletus edulis BED1 TaxID=1328754 RepID=A0AAD4BIV0_BOLED|nr:hypothetical protein EV363DRAFT_1441082 [Boletus edulis]KAF8431287.1 hypothetical protein L210DRAFT_953143 [Boletus edulis BED1]